ncbi:hypothetical protein [Treponema endosymbiont of Eucomonympha sp.]|uniref:hypothetical protein n=1 Tax=Treponema endosymbiont of Eucomonympha sp. TaxID=1580831 RepID=UPI000785F7A1|nr:hypothetical protein [Treponema endosymbiont of Eucomonympha sp.]
MNAARRVLTGAAVTAGVLGVGAGALVACRQELTPGAQSGAAGAERRPSYAKFDDGNYDFYFKNGAHVYGDCDGYDSEPGGKTTIYEWWQSDIEKWADRLRAAGIKPEVYKTISLEHCWVRFDTDLLCGIGYTGRERWMNNTADDKAFVAVNGKTTQIKHTRCMTYARAGGGFKLLADPALRFPDITGASVAQRNRTTPSLLITAKNPWFKDAETALRNAGIRVLETYTDDYGGIQNYIVVDASAIDWFAYDL